MIDGLTRSYQKAVERLPPRPACTIRQPYLSTATIAAFHYLRDWRSQLRVLQRNVRRTILSAAFNSWRGRPATVHDTLYHQRLVLGAYSLQEHALQSRVHRQARRDKTRHMLALTSQAANVWHSTGQPMPAITHLKWASRRAAERRSVFAAGGYDIEPQLEEQFRAQEGGLQVTPHQLAARINRWCATPSQGCPQAVPTLLAVEQCCLRQKEGKAPGPDSIPNEIWHHYPSQAGRWLWQVFSQSAISGHEPPGFKAALQCALYKKGPAALPSNYRSIALLNGSAKIWHSHLRGT